AAVNSHEKLRQLERFEDGSRGIDRFVREHRQLAPPSVRLQAFESFPYSRVNGGVVEFVLTVEGKKIFQCLFKKMLILRVSERASNKHRRAVANIGSHNFSGQFRTLEVSQHGIHRLDQVLPRVDKSSIEIENDQLY